MPCLLNHTPNPITLTQHMKTKHIIVGAATLFVVGGLFSFKIITNSWNVNSKDATITFEMPNGRHGGTVTGLSGTFQFNPMSPSKSMINATVQLANLKSDDDKLTSHLMTADFFDAAKHPTISFTSDSVSQNDTAFLAYGKLAMRDSIHNIVVPFKFNQGGKRAMFVGTMDLYAGDYGVGQKSEKKNDRVIVKIAVPVSAE